MHAHSKDIPNPGTPCGIGILHQRPKQVQKYLLLIIIIIIFSIIAILVVNYLPWPELQTYLAMKVKIKVRV